MHALQLLLDVGAGFVQRPGVLLGILAAALVLPPQEAPVEIFSPVESVSEPSMLFAFSLLVHFGREASRRLHALAKDHAANARVDKRHRTHGARLVRHVKFEVEAEVAVGRHVPLLECIEFQLRAWRIGKDGIIMIVEMLARDHAPLSSNESNGSHDSMSTRITFAVLDGTAVPGQKSDTTKLA